jgi:hypothetical protein
MAGKLIRVEVIGVGRGLGFVKGMRKDRFENG